MKVRIYRLRNPLVCGSPQQSRFFEPTPEAKEYSYACELVPDDKEDKKPSDKNKIGYFDDIELPLPVKGRVSDTDLVGLEAQLNAKDKFMLIPEISTLVHGYFKNKVVAEENKEEAHQSKRTLQSS